MSGEADEGEALHTYDAPAMTVEWRPSRCIHSGRCVAGLPRVFDPKRRPWIVIGDTTADAMLDTVRQCPSGALRLVRHDGGAGETPDAQVSVTPTPQGQLLVRGDLVVRDAGGRELRHDTRVSLCGCGKSSHAPFCDTTCEHEPAP